MVRGGSSRAVCAAAFLAVVVAACSGGDDGDGAAATDQASAPPTVPDDADAGLAYLVLDGEAHLLAVRSCALEAVLDEATGVTTDVAVDADDGVGLALSVTRQSFTAAVPTVTDTVTVVKDGEVLAEASRVETGGRFLDLRADGTLTPLFAVDGSLVTAAGVFGPPGSTVDDAGLVEGSLTLRCPPAG